MGLSWSRGTEVATRGAARIIALVVALAESASAPQVYCHPGSDAIVEVAAQLPGTH